MQLVLIGACLVLTNACVAFKGQKLQDPYPSGFPSAAQRPAINFSNESIIRLKNGSSSSWDNENIVKGHMLTSSGLFSSTQSIEDNEDFHFNFKTVVLEQDTSPFIIAAKKVYLGLSLATGGLLPYVERVKRILEVHVHQQEQILKRYRYQNNLWLVSSLFLLPIWRPSNEHWYLIKEARSNVDRNIVRTFLKDFHNDFLMPAKPTPSSTKLRPGASS